MREESAHADREVAFIAARQHGVISTGQLAVAGIGRSGVTRRLKAGRLHRIHRGVYAVGHPGLSNAGRWMGAVLALGPDAVLSHRSAAALWELLPPPDGAIDVTVGGVAGRKRRRGLRVHRSLSLTDIRTTRRAIPVTNPARTVADLRRVASPAQVRRAIRQAAVFGFVLALEPDGTRSELEYRFLRTCRRHRLPNPEVNARVGTFVVDFLWRERMLIVEIDGYRYHHGRQAFEDDRARDLKLRMSGFEVVRLTYRQLDSDPADVVASLRTLLSQ